VSSQPKPLSPTGAVECVTTCSDAGNPLTKESNES